MSDKKEGPEVTVESLQALVEELTVKLEAEGLKVVQVGDQLLIVSNELARERADHESTKENLANALSALTDAAAIIDGQKETITGLEARIAELQTTPQAFPVIEVNKTKYDVTAKSFKYKGETYTLAQLVKDKKLQKELVEKGVGFLVAKEV